jgi:hypothetical protein
LIKEDSTTKKIKIKVELNDNTEETTFYNSYLRISGGITGANTLYTSTIKFIRKVIS